MSIVSYNICSGKYGFKEFCKFISSCKPNPSVICLQEATTKLATDIKNAIKTYTIMKPSGHQGFNGNITLVHNDVIVKNINTVAISGVERDVLAIDITMPGVDRDMCIMNLHLKSGRISSMAEVRKKQVDEILGHVNSLKNKTCIIIGDWNLSKDEMMWPPTKGWKSPILIPTYRHNNMRVDTKAKFNHPFDRILYKGIKINDYRVINGEMNSDHDIICMSLCEDYKFCNIKGFNRLDVDELIDDKNNRCSIC